MVYIQTDTNGKITYENYDPSTLSSEILANGHTIDSMPAIENKVGFSVEKIYNATTGVVTINYVPIPLTTDQVVATLQTGLIDAQNAINMLLGV